METGTKEGRKGLVMVYTGNGKGKTTAAIGTMLRSYGRDFRICVIQYIKAASVGTGEFLAAQQLGIEWHHCGEGFVFTAAASAAEDAIAAREGWRLAQEKILAQTYDLVILDEFTYPLNFGWLDGAEVVAWLKANKPADLHLIITGRDASPEIIAYADLVTEMREIKHPYRQYRLPAQIGIEY